MKNTLLHKWLISFLILSPVIAKGQDVDHIDWKNPVKLSGSINLQLQSYSAVGIPDRQQPFTWLINGNPTLTILNVQLPFSFLISNFDNKYYQPFNQFGVSPYYKWIKLHLGYRSVQFSPFTLGGYRMLGAGVELTPGHLRFGFMYGRLNRSTQVDTAQNANPLAYRPPPTYTRLAYAVKIGVGTDKNYFDISFLKGWDKETSLNGDVRDSVPVQENKVIGFSWMTTIKKKIVWKTDIGLSIYDQDIHSTTFTDSSNSLLSSGFIKNFIQPTAATQYLIAGETRLGYHDNMYGADLVYRRVDPDYKSMGAYFFQTDIEQYSIAPYLRLGNGKYSFNGNIGTQHDNLYGLKATTSRNFIGSFNLNLMPSTKFGLNINYSNYGITQNPTRISPNDSSLFKQISSNYTFVPFLNFINDNYADNIQLVACFQQLNAPTAGLNTSPNQNTTVGSLIYSHSWLKKNITGNLSFNYNSTNLTGQGTIGSYGGGAGISFVAFKNKTNFSISSNYCTNFLNGSSNGYTTTGNLSCTIPIYKKHSVQLTGSYMNNNSKDETVVQTFSEYIFRIVYGLTF